MAHNITAIKAGVKAILESVAGVENVYSFQPEKVGSTPAIVFHTGPGRVLYPPAAPYGCMTNELTFICYLLFKDISFAASEADIDTFLPLVMTALGHDMNAGGAIGDGQVLLTRYEPVYYTVGTTKYHAMEFILTAIDTVTYTYAL